MTTLLQVQANRRNALKSTGPRTPHGKAISRRNAARLDLSGWEPVLMPGESRKAWDKFLRQILVDLDPVGPVEATWAGRMAQLMWRIRRLSGYRQTLADQQWREAAATVHLSAWWQERRRADKNFPTTMATIGDGIRIARARLAVLQRILALPPGPCAEAGQEADPAAVTALIDYAAEHIRASDELTEMCRADRFPGLGVTRADEDVNSFIWTLGMARDGLTEVAALKGETWDGLAATLAPAVAETVRSLRSAHRRAQRELRCFRHCSMAKTTETLPNFTDTEATLSRSLAQAHRQLRRLQADRCKRVSRDARAMSPSVVKMGFVQVETSEKQA